MSFALVIRIAELDPRDLEVPRPRAQAPAKKVDLWFGGAASEWPEAAFAPPPIDDTAAEDARAARFRAKYHGADRRTVSLRAMSALLEALTSAGAIFEAPATMHAGPYGDGDRGPRGPLREVPSYKLGSNDGWHVTRDEADVLASRLSSALAGGLEPDPKRAAWLHDLAMFFRAAAEQHGFEVW